MSTNTGAAGAMGGGGNKRLAQQQAQVDEVVDIMRQNVDKVLERDKNLSMLDDRADKLQHNAAQFEQHAGKLKRKYWWKNMKMMIIMGIVGVIFAIVVIGWIASKVKEVTPVVPTASPVVVNSPSNDGLPKAPGAAIGSGDKQTSRRRSRKPKKTTTPTPASDQDNDAPEVVNPPPSKGKKKEKEPKQQQ